MATTHRHSEAVSRRNSQNHEHLTLYRSTAEILAWIVTGSRRQAHRKREPPAPLPVHRSLTGALRASQALSLGSEEPTEAPQLKELV